MYKTNYGKMDTFFGFQAIDLNSSQISKLRTIAKTENVINQKPQKRPEPLYYLGYNEGNNAIKSGLV